MYQISKYIIFAIKIGNSINSVWLSVILLLCFNEFLVECGIFFLSFYLCIKMYEVIL